MTDAPFEFLALGAIIQSFQVKGINIVQGFPTKELYEQHNSPFFGETIGRIANRVKNAKIDSLNGGKSYTLAANNGVNHLHGGNKGWGKREWNGPKPVGVRSIPGVDGLEGGESVQFSLLSEDGDEGYPGSVETIITYTAGVQKQNGKEVNVLGIDYETKLVGGADETAINLTNHSYFNLTGGPTIEGTEITLATDKPDIDDCFVVNEAAGAVPLDTRNSPLTTLVQAYHPESKVHLEVASTEPAFQFYTGKYIDVPAVGGLPARGKRSGFCVEPSRYVNAINVDEWRSQSVLKRGDVYGARIVYRGWSE
ncbi:bifunctional protein GAL10 [Verticillium alfalfae VaMs.102]|uniref:Bifunctional protein GAL10 n=1 Tax=Verticillium alfalfae (strain VaMs.102 / ATCC MYA-4576 / FGSC 10136) TaxID=526221 RepID=C9SD10_VERA1|nr:bifunctional protein GAL10 [Verticillium alfalfae VaMs.102]EEY16975.1 bifunctional protein GAL10 [Verticillium alfalfae VaMs.102]